MKLMLWRGRWRGNYTFFGSRTTSMFRFFTASILVRIGAAQSDYGMELNHPSSLSSATYNMTIDGLYFTKNKKRRKTEIFNGHEMFRQEREHGTTSNTHNNKRDTEEDHDNKMNELQWSNSWNQIIFKPQDSPTSSAGCRFWNDDNLLIHSFPCFPT